MAIEGGTITISQCYEGIEALTIDINGGVLDITSSDDGINASGGSASTGNDGFMGAGGGNGFGAVTSEDGEEGSGYVSLAMTDTAADASQTQDGSVLRGHGGMGGGMMDVEEDAYLRITGGEVTVNSGGDSLDTNGNLYIDGGTILVYGPTNSGNGALDYGGNTVLSFTPEKQFQNVILSSPELAEGTYTLTVGSDSQEVTVCSVTTTIGSAGNGGGMMSGMPQDGSMPQGGGMRPGGFGGGMHGSQSGTAATG